MDVKPDILKKSIESLLGLQEIDAQLFRVNAAIQAPSEEHLALQKKVAELRRWLQTSERQMRDLEREKRGFELKLLTAQEDIKKAEAKKREVRNTKEEFSANKELENIQKRVGDLKTIAEEKSKALEQIASSRAEKEASLQTLEGELKSSEEQVKARQSELETEKRDLIAKRESFIQAVDEQIFPLYERIQKLRKGSGISIVKGLICSGCHVSIPPQLKIRLDKMEEIITCPSCSRILYPGESTEAEKVTVN